MERLPVDPGIQSRQVQGDGPRRAGRNLRSEFRCLSTVVKASVDTVAKTVVGLAVISAKL